MKRLELLETKYIKLGFRRIPIRLSFRSMIEYEKISGGKVQDISGTENLIMFFYCAAKAGARNLSEELGMSYEEFLKKVDENPQSFVDFTDILFEGIDDESDVKKNWNLFMSLT